MVKKVIRNSKEIVEKRIKRLALILGLFAFSLYVGFILSNIK